MSLNPKKISLLGFDHDYNPEKVKKWKEAKNPNIQNRFSNKSEKTIKEWGDNFFSNMVPDSFYGLHSTPDPLRLEVNHLIEKFALAEECAKKLDIDLGNLSPVTHGLNPLKKHSLIF